MLLEKINEFFKRSLWFSSDNCRRIGREALIPASLVFAHFVSFVSSSSCPRAGKELVALVAAADCPWLPGSVQLLLACLKDNQNVDGRIMAACSLDVLHAPDSNCIVTTKADQSPSVPSFWAPLIHRIYWHFTPLLIVWLFHALTNASFLFEVWPSATNFILSC